MPLLQASTQDLDRIILSLVPKAVDNVTQDPELFRDEKRCMDYATQQAKEFLARLPETYRKGLTEQQLDKGTKIFANSNYELGIGFRPGYQLLIYTNTVITAPIFDLSFKPTTNKDTRAIFEAALNQFFLQQLDIADGTLAAYGIKDEQTVVQDLELLRLFLPRRWVFKRKIQAICNYALGSGRAVYLI